MAFIVHVPHASTFIAIEVMDQFLLSPNELAEEAMTSADLYTDILAKAAWPNAQILTAAVSRVVIDVERYSNDAEEIMAKYGRYILSFLACRGRTVQLQG